MFNKSYPALYKSRMLLLLVTFHTSFLYILCLSHKLVSPPPTLPFDPPPSNHFPITLLFLSRGHALASLLLFLLRLSFILLPFPQRRIMLQALCHSPSQCDVIHVKGLEGLCFFFFQPSFAGTKWTVFYFKSYTVQHVMHTVISLLARVCWDKSLAMPFKVYIYIYNFDDVNQ